MKKALLVMSVLGFVALQACNEEKKQNTNESSTTTVDTTTSVPNNTGIQENSQQPMTGQEVQIPNTQPAAVPASAQTATGMNPAHGQPGHRCDIAVGAPLSSPPGQNPNVTPDVPNGSSPQTITMPAVHPSQPQMQTTAPASGPTAPGMNPPHGQPGHDCAIAVVAPLKK
jgi:hypothetical protein